MKKMVIKIDGMKCNNCANHVCTALSNVDGVEKCKVSLKKGEATIVTNKDISKDIISKVVEDAGYKVIW